jgi:hypothetical protein
MQHAEEIVQPLGLRFRRSSAPNRWILGDSNRDLRISVELSWREEPAGPMLHVLVRSRPPFPTDVSLTPRQIGGPDGLWVGDLDLDRDVLIEGNEVFAYAILDAKSRERIRELLHTFGARVLDGCVSLGFGDLLETGLDPRRFESALRQALELVRALALEETPWQRLLRNAREDPQPEVRIRSAELILEADSAAGPDLCQAAIEALHQVHGAGSWPQEARADALEALFDWASPEEASRLVAQGLLDPSPAVRRTALERVKEGTYPATSARLVALLGAVDEEAAVVLIPRLAEQPDPTAEIALVECLDRGSSKVKTAAARVLGQIGTLRAVEPLLRYTKGFFVDRSLKRAAREAVSAIQSRHAGAEAGRLSIAELADTGGGLSLAEEPGALSLAPPADVGPEAG